MKRYIGLLVVFFILGCKDDNEQQKRIAAKERKLDSLELVVEQKYDSMIRVNDSVLKSMDKKEAFTAAPFNCDSIKVSKPYYFIKWTDGSYGILYRQFIFDSGIDWYLVNAKKEKHHFEQIREYGYHYKDSCAAKKDFKVYLDDKKASEFNIIKK